MKKTFKKMLSILIVTAMLFSLIPYIGNDVYAADQVITSVELGTSVSEPVAGEPLYYMWVNSVNGKESLVSLLDLDNSVCGWFCSDTYSSNTDNYSTYPYDTFLGDYSYDLFTALYPVDGAVFSSSCKVTMKTPAKTLTGKIRTSIPECLIFEFVFPEIPTTPLKITKQPVSTSAPDGENVKVTVEAQGDGVTYQWWTKSPGSSTFSKSSITSNTYTTNMTDAKDGRQVYCIVKDKYGNSIRSYTVRLDMFKITHQPQNASAEKGDNVSVTVHADGYGITYQWWIKNPGSSTFSKSSITSNTYTTNMTAAKDGRQVYCVLTDSSGNTIKTNTVTLSMLKFIQQPVNASAASGENVSVTVKVTGEGVTYHWWVKNPGSSTFSASSITSNTYTTNMTAAKDGRQLYCEVIDKHGNSIFSDIVTLSMIEKTELAITEQPATTSAVKGKNVSVTVSAQGDGLTYQWYVKNPGSSSYSRSSVTSATYTTNMTAAKDGRLLHCVVKDKYGNTVRSNTVKIVMLSIAKQPVSASAAKGENVSVTVSAQGDGLTYQWYVKSPGSSSFSKSSVTSATYTTNMTAAKDGRQLYCVIKDKYGSTITSNTVTITMK